MYEYQRILQPSRSSSENDNSCMSADSRKSNKPLLEKKRRARINRSLEQLKALLIDTIKSDHATGYSKLEKADILELAVKYLRNVRTQQVTGVSVVDAKTVTARYQAGFSECATEVDRYLASVDGLGPDTRGRLMSHLACCIRHRQLPPPPNAPAIQHPHHSAAYAPPTLVTSSMLQHHHQPQQQQPSAGLVRAAFGHYDVTMTSSISSSSPPQSPFAAASHFQPVSMATSSSFQSVTSSPLFRQSSPECWRSSSFVGGSDGGPSAGTTMDDSGLYSGGAVDDSRTTNIVSSVRHADDEDEDEPEAVTTTWNGHVRPPAVRPLAERNNNVENIARNVGAATVDAVKFQRLNELMNTADEECLMDEAVKDEPVWRPW